MGIRFFTLRGTAVVVQHDVAANRLARPKAKGGVDLWYLASAVISLSLLFYKYVQVL